MNCKCCDTELKSKWELFRGTCDTCVELYKMGAYPMGFPNRNINDTRKTKTN